MPKHYKCERCGEHVTAKFLWTPAGCVHCVCKRCGKSFDLDEQRLRNRVKLLEDGTWEVLSSIHAHTCDLVKSPF